jgi:hypothetical protein
MVEDDRLFSDVSGLSGWVNSTFDMDAVRIGFEGGEQPESSP